MQALICRKVSWLLYDRRGVTALEYAIVTAALISTTVMVADAMAAMLGDFVVRFVSRLG